MRNNREEDRPSMSSDEARLKQVAIFYVSAELVRRGLDIFFKAGVPEHDILANKPGGNPEFIHVDVYGSYDSFNINKDKVIAMNKALNDRYFIILVKLSRNLDTKPIYKILNRRMAMIIVGDEEFRAAGQMSSAILLNQKDMVNNWKDLPIEFLI